MRFFWICCPSGESQKRVKIIRSWNDCMACIEVETVDPA